MAMAVAAVSALARMTGRTGERPASAAIATQSAPASARRRTVIFYLIVAGCALVPGVLSKLDGYLGIPQIDIWLDSLKAILGDIRFGRGVRFWSGVMGAGAMALLLLYPLRKLLGKSRSLGSVGGWFHVHMIIGIFGPVLVLYHCNFGTGSANANVALWSMLTVVASGLVGHFVYAGVSAAFYADTQRARSERDAISDILASIDIATEQRTRILLCLEDFDQRLLTPRRGVLAGIAARVTLERERAGIACDLGAYIGAVAHGQRLDAPTHDQLRRTVARHFGAYMRLARRAASRSIREQLWARWRLFHLPLFLIMAVAAILHVIAVWGLDAPHALMSDPAATATAELAPVFEPPLITPDVAPPALSPRPSAARKVVAKAPGLLPKTAPAFDLDPTLVSGPRLATRPATAGVTVTVPTSPATPTAGAITAVAADTDQLLAELLRRTQDDQLMALGATLHRSLAVQIALLKARQQAGTFAHTTLETGFALVGHHRKADCASCHTKPLRETRSTDPRACLDCHKNDDVHRGRRPDCGQCHTPNRWGELLQRR